MTPLSLTLTANLLANIFGLAFNYTENPTTCTLSPGCPCHFSLNYQSRFSPGIPASAWPPSSLPDFLPLPPDKRGGNQAASSWRQEEAHGGRRDQGKDPPPRVRDNRMFHKQTPNIKHPKNTEDKKQCKWLRKVRGRRRREDITVPSFYRHSFLELC